MARNLVVNGVTYNGVESLEIPDDAGEAIPYVELPELTNPGSAADLRAGKELIDADGKVVTGEIEERTMDDVTINGNQISIPEGYYPGGGKFISTQIQSNPSISVNANGLITASMELKAGYVSAATKESTKQLTTQSAKTVTPTKSAQTAVASGRYTTGAIQVAAIPDQYQDVTPVTATAEDVAAGKVFVDATGAVVTGTAEVGGGSAGGAGLETCTVEWTQDGSGPYVLSTQMIDGVAVPFYLECASSGYTWQAPCRSVIVIASDLDLAFNLDKIIPIETDGAALPYIPAGIGAMDAMSAKVFRIDAGAGEIARMYLEENL